MSEIKSDEIMTSIGIASFNTKYGNKIFNKYDDVCVKFRTDYLVKEDYEQSKNNINVLSLIEKAVVNKKISKPNKSDIVIKIPNRSYFHKTIYADFYYKKFGIELKPDTFDFNISYDILSSTIKFYHCLIHYKNNKLERYEHLINILKYCLNKYKKSYRESYDLYIIKLYNRMKKWYKELKDMNKINKYNFISLEKEVENHIYLIKNSNLLDINYIQKKSLNYSNKNTYSVFMYPTYESCKVNYNISLLNNFRKRYNHDINALQFSFLLDTLTTICNIHKTNINSNKSILKSYFLNYPKLIEINDDFNENYKLLILIKNILNLDNIDQINILKNTLIQKNIHFLEIDKFKPDFEESDF